LRAGILQPRSWQRADRTHDRLVRRKWPQALRHDGAALAQQGRMAIGRSRGSRFRIADDMARSAVCRVSADAYRPDASRRLLRAPPQAALGSRGNDAQDVASALACSDTPSFFCRLVDDVVYWNTIRALGSTTCFAACAISAASW